MKKEIFDSLMAKENDSSVISLQLSISKRMGEYIIHFLPSLKFQQTNTSPKHREYVSLNIVLCFGTVNLFLSMLSFQKSHRKAILISGIAMYILCPLHASHEKPFIPEGLRIECTRC